MARHDSDSEDDDKKKKTAETSSSDSDSSSSGNLIFFLVFKGTGTLDSSPDSSDSEAEQKKSPEKLA